jgi:hypothetical protein
MMQRQFFDFTDTGTQALTGPNFSGQIEQYRWVNVSGDTGGTLEIGLYPRAGDTGDGFVFASHGLVPQLTKAPRQPMHGSDGSQLDTGADLSDVIVAAGDRLRAVKTGASGVGRLYVWTRDN